MTEPAGIPRWVKVTVAVVATLALVVIAVLLVGGHHAPAGGH
jgi:hypothetical protein